MKKIFVGVTIFLICFCCGYFFVMGKGIKPGNIITVNGFDVKLNPYEKNELAALIEFETKEPAVIKMVVQGKNGAADISYTFPEKKQQHSIEVLGLYPNHRNKIVLTAQYDDKNEQNVIVIPTPKITKKSFLTVTQKNDKKTYYHWVSDGLVLDEDGWVRFAFDGGGAILYWFNHEVISEYRNQGIYRYSPAGKLLQHYPHPKGFTSFTHGMGQKPNKNFLLIGSFADSTVLVDGEEQKSHRDYVIEIDYHTGEMVNKIDLAEILNPNRSVIVPKGHIDYGMNDWCHINGVDYDESDGGIVISCRHSGMIKVNEKSKDVVWMITPNKGFETSGRQGKGPDIHHKVLTAINKKGKPFKQAVQQGQSALPEFKWPTRTHNARSFGNGIFGIFDNSGAIHDVHVSTTNNSYASLWKVDEKKHTVQQYWIQPLESQSAVGSSVSYDPKEQSVIVLASQIFDKNQSNISYSDLIRYDFETHKEMFRAVLYRGGVTYGYYASQKFSFYPKNTKDEE